MRSEFLRMAIGAIAMLLASVAVALAPIPWRSLGLWGYPGIFLACTIGGLGAFLPSPALGLVVSAGRPLAPLLVGLCAGAGFALGEVPLYAAMRTDMARRVVPAWLFPARLERQFHSLERSWLWWPIVFLVAVIPTPLFDCVTIFCGRWKVSPLRFIVPIAMGRIVRCIVVAYSAAAIGAR